MPGTAFPGVAGHGVVVPDAALPGVAAVLTAAGSGSRLGHALPKGLVPLAGEPLVRHAARRLLAAGIGTLVVTAPAEHLDAVSHALEGLGIGRLVVVAGGVSRQASVAAGLDALAALEAGEGARPATVVLVHDAARCLTPPEVISRVVEAVRAGACAVTPVLPVTDTIVEITSAGPGPGDVAGAVRITGTPNRSRLRLVQTPQGFDREVLERAHAAARHRADDEATAATDDASLVAALGLPVHAVQGHASALKVTTRADLDHVERLLNDASAHVTTEPSAPGAQPAP